MDKERIIKEVIRIIRTELTSGYQILIFGSWAKKDAQETSDIDVGILGKEKVPWEIMVKIKQEVEKIPTLRTIDVLDLNSVEESFKKNVLKYAKVLA